jgi:small GTP-binding protein
MKESFSSCNSEDNQVIELKNDYNDNNNQSKNEDILDIERGLQDESEYNRSIKVIFLGDSSVGKSSIIQRICFKDNQVSPPATISIENYNYLVKVNDYIIRMNIWDNAGQEKYDSIVKKYYENADFGIYVYSIDDEKSFERIKVWLSISNDNNQKVNNNEMTCILLGNKKDLEKDKRKITFEKGKQLAEKYHFYLFKEISCLDQSEEERKNIVDVFDEIAKYYYKLHKERALTLEEDSIMEYEASKSFIEMSRKISIKENEEKNAKNIKNKKKKCC